MNFLYELVVIGQYILSLASGFAKDKIYSIKELIVMVIEFFLIVPVYASRKIKSVTCGIQNLNEDTGRQDVLQRLTKNMSRDLVCAICLPLWGIVKKLFFRRDWL